MRRVRVIQVSWILLLAALVLGVSFMTPALAANKTVQHSTGTAQQNASTPVNAIIYLTTSSLQPMFQSHIDQQLPVAFTHAITRMISKLPKQDQGWAMEMATTLIQPSATLVRLSPQQNGLAMTLLLSLYPGDPKAITSTILISFNVLDSSTVQVSATPLNGSPALVSGPLATFQLPLGSLNAIKSTPGCGAAGLALNLQFPVSVGQAQASAQAPQFSTTPSGASPLTAKQGTVPGVNSFIEIPAPSLSALSNTLGSMPVGNGFTAQNIRIQVNGSNLDILADIYWSGIDIGTADTTIAPSAANGKMVLHVLSTTMSLFGLFTFPVNSYNQQIEQTLNAKLGNAFAGKFYVTNAAIGPNSQLPCAAGDSLVLTGNIAALG